MTMIEERYLNCAIVLEIRWDFKGRGNIHLKCIKYFYLVKLFFNVLDDFQNNWNRKIKI